MFGRFQEREISISQEHKKIVKTGNDGELRRTLIEVKDFPAREKLTKELEVEKNNIKNI